MSIFSGLGGRARGLFADNKGPWGPSGGRRRTTAFGSARRQPARGASRPSAAGARPTRHRRSRLARRVPPPQPRRASAAAAAGCPAASGRSIFCGRSSRWSLLWLVFTSIHSIAPGQRGVVTRFGRYSYTLGPGVGLTLPSPIDRVQKIDVENIRSDRPRLDRASEDADADRRPEHASTSLIRCAGTSATPELYLFELAQPDETIRQVAESAMRAVISQVSACNDAMGDRRGDIETAGPGRDAADPRRLSFGRRRSRASRSSRPIRRRRSTTRSRRSPPRSRKPSPTSTRRNAYALQLTAKAQGEATAFDKVYEQYKLAPDVTRRRMYYETMEQVLSKVDKTIVEAPGVTPYLPLPAGQAEAAPREPAQ